MHAFPHFRFVPQKRVTKMFDVLSNDVVEESPRVLVVDGLEVNFEMMAQETPFGRVYNGRENRK